MAKKIALIVERANIALGGAERCVFELAEDLSRRGLQVDILAAKGRSNAGKVRILCDHLPGERVNCHTFARALRKHLAQNSYDIVHSVLPFDFAHVYQPHGGTYAETIVRNAASYQNRFIEYYKRLTAFANLRRAALLRAERRLCGNPAGPVIVCISQYVARQFRQHYGLDEERIRIVPNGVKIEQKANAQEAARLHKQIFAGLKLKETARPVLLLFAANNFRLKGLSPLIRAMGLAAQNNGGFDSYLVVAGRDRPRRYQGLARRFHIEKRIVFLGNVRHIQDILSIVDVAVLPTFYDPSSRFAIEALATAKPVITTRHNGATDLFVDGRHGRVINSATDAAALAEAIEHFADVENIRKASDAILADKLKDKVSIDPVVRQFCSIYDSILEKRK